MGAMPAGQGIVEGGEIPYTPAAATKQKENLQNRMKLDPEMKCYMPGIPRANYMPFPFQIVQSQRDIAFAYEYATSNRVVNMGKFKEGAVDTWMGTSNGHWEGDYAGGRCQRVEREQLVRPVGEFPNRQHARGGTLHAGRRRSHQLRGEQSRIRRSIRGRGRSARSFTGGRKRTRSSTNSNAWNTRKKLIYGDLKKK